MTTNTPEEDAKLPPGTNPVINKDAPKVKAEDNPAVSNDMLDAYGTSAPTGDDGLTLDAEHSGNGRADGKFGDDQRY